VTSTERLVTLVQKMRRTGRASAAASTNLQTSSERSSYPALIGAERRGARWVADGLRKAIAGGAYEHGRRLPAERQIADAFAVSRGTVREALRLLHEDGVVERRTRIGTFVTTGGRHTEEDVAEITSPLELMEVRQAIEPQIVRLVVLNAKPRDIARIGQALHELERAEDRQSFSEWDQRFHLAMAEATHNPLMILIYRQINHVRAHAQWQAIKDKVLTPDRVQAYNREHRALFEAIKTRDAEAALAIVFAHLQSARSDLQSG
jgi:DNA-binding FadR family transcriptional regulator